MSAVGAAGVGGARAVAACATMDDVGGMALSVDMGTVLSCTWSMESGVFRIIPEYPYAFCSPLRLRAERSDEALLGRYWSPMT